MPATRPPCSGPSTCSHAVVSLAPCASGSAVRASAKRTRRSTAPLRPPSRSSRCRRRPGNAAVSRLLARQPISNTVPRNPAPGPLTLQEEDDGVESANRKFDEASIRALQELLGTPQTGVAGPVDVQAIGAFKRKHGVGRHGIVTQDALDAFVVEGAKLNRHDEVIHLVSRFFKLDTSAEVLSIRYDPTVTTVPSNVSFEGPLRLIVIGPIAFASAAAVRVAIMKMVFEPNPLAHVQPAPPLFGMGGPRILQPNQLDAAVAANARRFRDHRRDRGRADGARRQRHGPHGSSDGAVRGAVPEHPATRPPRRIRRPRDACVDRDRGSTRRRQQRSDPARARVPPARQRRRARRALRCQRSPPISTCATPAPARR